MGKKAGWRMLRPAFLLAQSHEATKKGFRQTVCAELVEALFLFSTSKERTAVQQAQGDGREPLCGFVTLCEPL
jgi:hypothetical protein